MRVLVVGSGGREHALVWALHRSSQVTEVLAAPGNGGTAGLARNVDIGVNDFDALVALARDEAVALTVVGPEDPLAGGLVDRFRAEGLAVFGPPAAAARLEGSKAFANDFMERNGIPTGASSTFTDHAAAIAHLDTLDAVPVVKYDGLAAGKGVFVPETHADAVSALDEIFVEERFGPAADAVVVLEERLYGVEASVLAFCDGTSLSVMPIAQDHKRLADGDAGPNTGGMGAFVPSPVVDAELLADIEARILRPVLKGMEAEGSPYTGVLYAGIMVTAEGPKVIEYNCRFGDPETQVVLPLLESDLFDVMMSCVDGRLGEMTPRWSPKSSASVFMASGGYPGSYPSGIEISGLSPEAGEEFGQIPRAAPTATPDGVDEVIVFHAGTARDDHGALVTAGGRVLAVTTVGDRLEDAVAGAYNIVDQISFDGAIYRSDIGRPA
jgi:phosphoribosylamine--glycine ligase